MTGIYFSGTGNTKYCAEHFVSAIDKNAKCFSLEDDDVQNEILQHETIVFGYPIYYSNVPKIAKDFIIRNKAAFEGKKVFIIATKGAFNAFGIGYAVKIFEACGSMYIGSLQLNMPDNIRDLMIMEIAFTKNYKKIIEKADRKILKAALRFKAGMLPKSGLNPLNYILGFFLKVLWFYPKTDAYITAPKVDNEKCNGCGKCSLICPMSNITVTAGKAVSSCNCTICYRCFNNCPAQALTILGKKVYDQYNF